MAGQQFIITLKDSSGSNFDQRVWDESGTGIGPFRPVYQTPALAPIAGQQLVTTAAVALPNHVLVNGIVIKAKATNSGIVFVGTSSVNTLYDGTGTGFPLAAGEGINFSCSNSNQIFIIGTNGDIISFGGN